MVSERLRRKYGWGWTDSRDKPPVEKDTAFNRKKNTKKWCKGKPGVQHDPRVVIPKNAMGVCREIRIFSGRGDGERTFYTRWYCLHCVECAVCHKILDPFVAKCPDLP